MDNYAKKLVENLSVNSNKCISIDLVLDGGLFNGSYQIGALYILKEMELRNIINIKRISGSSIGSLNAFLYIIDRLDLIFYFYKIMCNILKKKKNLQLVLSLHKLLDKHITEEICNIVNKKLYISFHSVPKCKKYVKSVYKDKYEIINTIIKSCYIPYFIDGNFTFENKYIDGMNPYIFNIKKGRKILFLDLFGNDKILQAFYLKNEKTNMHRVLSGMLDIYNFFIKKCNTNMCSYVNNWSLLNQTKFLIKIILEKIIIYFIYIIHLFSYIKFPLKKKNFFRKLLANICDSFLKTIIECYCV